MSQLQPTIEEYLNDYNAESKQPMPLVMFMDAISHVARITRVLRQPKGNMLLLGVGGSGRQSLSRLSTFMAECKIFSIEITKGYGLSEWRESLKEILLYAGIKAQPAVFLFSDTQIVFEAMLEDINNVLNTGDVPNLYAPEDDETITTVLTQRMLKLLQRRESRLRASSCRPRRSRRVRDCLCQRRPASRTACVKGCSLPN